MKAEAYIIRTNARIEKIHPANGKYFELAEMQNIVGGYIEQLPANNGEYVLIVNEEGKLLNLEYNPLATLFYNNRDTIVGNVIFCLKSLIR